MDTAETTQTLDLFLKLLEIAGAVVVPFIIVWVGKRVSESSAKQQAITAGSGVVRDLLLRADDLLLQMQYYLEACRRGHIMQYGALLPEARQISDELMRARVGLPNEKALFDTAIDLLQLSKILPVPYKDTVDAVTPVHARMQARHPEIFAKLEERTRAALLDVRKAIEEHNGFPIVGLQPVQPWERGREAPPALPAAEEAKQPGTEAQQPGTEPQPDPNPAE